MFLQNYKLHSMHQTSVENFGGVKPISMKFASFVSSLARLKAQMDQLVPIVQNIIDV